MTVAGREALRMMAETEALLLDPVYTARAAAQLIANVRSGRVPAGSSVIFMHTGGSAGGFCRRRILAALAGKSSLSAVFSTAISLIRAKSSLPEPKMGIWHGENNHVHRESKDSEFRVRPDV